MKTTLLLFVTLCLGVGPLRAEKMFEGESLGSFKLGQGSDAVVKALGKPDSKGKAELWEAIGEWVQEWHYAKQGLTLAMSSKNRSSAQTIYSITAEAPCKLATSRGITIGSAEADLKAYNKERNGEESEPGERFVAGSIYGGVIFTIKSGKVAHIFIGAAAE